MAARSRAREVALQLLFQFDQNPVKVGRRPIERFAADRLTGNRELMAFCLDLYDGVQKHRPDLDARLSAIAENWKLHRMMPVDRNVLRLGAFELLHAADPQPLEVVIDEAVELARRYGTKDSPGFVNGILDKVGRMRAAQQAAAPAAADLPPALKSELRNAERLAVHRPVPADRPRRPDGRGRSAHPHHRQRRRLHPGRGGRLRPATKPPRRRRHRPRHPGRRANRGGWVRVVPGVEMSAGLDGRETHILGLFVRPDHRPLIDHLAGVCERRRERFHAYLAGLRAAGADIPGESVAAVEASATSLGRRHLAGLLLRAGQAKTRYDAFARFLHPLAGRVPPTHLTPAADAIARLREAGGVVALAHPPRQVTEADLRRFRDLGGQAVEVVFPAALVGHTQRLRGLCKQLGLAVAGGSDCHGADVGRGVGSRGVTRDEFAALEALAGSPG